MLKKTIGRQSDTGSLGMGTFVTRQERRKAGGPGKKKGRGSLRIAKPPVGGWSGGDPDKNGSRR